MIASSALVALAVWPGRMSADTIVQLAQARGDVAVNNWHAGTLVALWRPLYAAGLRPGVLLFAVVFVCHLSVFVPARLRLSRPASAAVAVAVCWFPPVLGYLVVLSRDTWFAVAHLATAAALLRWVSCPVAAYRRWWAVAAVAAAEVAVLARQNAIAGSTVLLAVAVALGVARRLPSTDPHRTRTVTGVAVGAAVGVAVTLTIVNRALGSLLGIEDVHPEQAPMVLDLAVLSVRNDEMLLPASVYPRQDPELLEERLDPYRTGSVVFGADPLVPFPVPDDAIGDLQRAWRRAVLDHPFDHVAARTGLLLRQIGWAAPPVWTYHPGIDPNDLGYEAANPWLDDRVNGYLDRFTTGDGPSSGTDAARPVWYVVLGAVALAVIVWRRDDLGRPTVAVLVGLGVSAVTYLGGVFLGATTSNYRFTYPVVLIGCGLATAAAGALWSSRPVPAAVARGGGSSGRPARDPGTARRRPVHAAPLERP